MSGVGGMIWPMNAFFLGYGGWVSVAANFMPKMSAEFFTLVEKKE